MKHFRSYCPNCCCSQPVSEVTTDREVRSECLKCGWVIAVEPRAVVTCETEEQPPTATTEFAKQWFADWRAGQQPPANTPAMSLPTTTRPVRQKKLRNLFLRSDDATVNHSGAFM